MLEYLLWSASELEASLMRKVLLMPPIPFRHQLHL